MIYYTHQDKEESNMVNLTNEQISALKAHGWITENGITYYKSFEKDYETKSSIDMIINPGDGYCKEDFCIAMSIEKGYHSVYLTEYVIWLSELMRELVFLGSIGIQFDVEI